MRKFVGEHLKYPEAALKSKVEGTVTIRYSLDYRGKVVATKIKSGLGHGCDEEAMRVVELMRFTVPQASKKKVRIHQDINIHFKLPKKKAAQPPKPSKTPHLQDGRTGMTITYSTPTKPIVKQQKAQEKSRGSIGYTISW